MKKAVKEPIQASTKQVWCWGQITTAPGTFSVQPSHTPVWNLQLFHDSVSKGFRAFLAQNLACMNPYRIWNKLAPYAPHIHQTVCRSYFDFYDLSFWMLWCTKSSASIRFTCLLAWAYLDADVPMGFKAWLRGIRGVSHDPNLDCTRNTIWINIWLWRKVAEAMVQCFLWSQ